MPKYPRGILGVKKDPKNQVLFSFNVREGDEWPSDDDEDDDYNPGDDSDSGAKKSTTRKSQKRQKGTSRTQRNNKKQKLSQNDKDAIESSRLMNSDAVPMLPPEIWEKIFMIIVKKEGAIPFLLRAERVCQMWKEICTLPHLWHTVDMSYGWIKSSEAKFKAFCRNRLSQCKDLNVSGCVFMKNAWAVDAIVKFCPNLRTINLSHCKKLPNGSVEKIVTGCKYLEDIDLNSTTTDAVSTQTLNLIADKCRSNLKRIVICNNMVKSINIFLTSLTWKCPNLEYLDVSNVKFTSGWLALDLLNFQRRCPKLKRLYLSNVVTQARFDTGREQALAEFPGFTNLEELSMAHQESYLSCETLRRILKNATKLTLLDLRGCTAEQIVCVLKTIDCPNLQHLYLSKSDAATCQCLCDIMKKWRHSLTDLDLSWNNYSRNVLESALTSLCEGEGDCNIQSLNLSGTRVDMEHLRKVLHSLTQLETLDLSSCRDLDRGCKRIYKTHQEIQQLRKSLKL
ncbi:F-box/LRR-repeat protein 6 [Mactra antiquata]